MTKDFHHYLKQAEYLIEHGYYQQSITILAERLQKIDEEKEEKSISEHK